MNKLAIRMRPPRRRAAIVEEGRRERLLAACGHYDYAALDPLPARCQGICSLRSRVSAMRSRELLRKLRRLGATVDAQRGKGGHVQVELAGRKSIIPTGSKELRSRTLHSILRDLGLRSEDLS